VKSWNNALIEKRHFYIPSISSLLGSTEKAGNQVTLTSAHPS
jgi:hypothetical protein